MTTALGGSLPNAGIAPEAVVISANGTSHPRSNALNAILSQTSQRTYCTNVHGEITIRIARAGDPRIRQALVSYRENRQRVLIANSEGMLREDDRSYLTAVVQVVAAGADGVVQTGYEAVGGLAGLELFEREPFEQAAETAARRAVTRSSSATRRT